ncbi:hypothetical protein IC582_002255 [Cucumis melo]|uniref:Glutathione transport system permease gsiD n=2 Tax=Cucumis melo TaxID=3656 RepID=A0A5D3BI04_CUCMM|nr:Glutathione transport system permease gsiD [Cucumis melo var. makuwa]TYJ98706.1 Glutathione transport system permease gsiD [Cucumis melo var. makuwa]
MNSIFSSIEFRLLPSPNPPQPQHNLHIFHQIHLSPQTTYRFNSIKTNSILPTNSLILGNSTIPPAQSGDISVLLQTSGVLLIAYLIANFIFPEFIMKSYRSDDESEGKGGGGR